MTSGKARALTTLWLTLLAATAAAAPDPALDALLARLARPPPATTAFVEVRWSRLLNAPLVSAGELEYRGSDHLVRSVQRPFQERTEVQGNDVRIERRGQTAHRFSLERAPELRGLLAGFAGLLGADRASLERWFAVSASFDGQRWRIHMAPTDAGLGQRLEAFDIVGQDDVPRCLALSERNGGYSVTLLGAAAAIELPKPPTREWLERRCAGDT